MRWKPVHTYVKLVQCPRCRYYFMPEGTDCCWHCQPEVHPALPPGNALGTPSAWRASQTARVEAEIQTGTLGTLAGMGFAPPAFKDASPDNPDAELTREAQRLLFLGLVLFLALAALLALFGPTFGFGASAPR